MRWMRWILAIAAAQLCTFGAIATLISGCAGPANPLGSDDDPGAGGGNRVPEITSLTVEPSRLVVGGTATVLAQASDPDGDRITWSLALNTQADFPVQGRFSPQQGSGGAISSTFTATGTGLSSVILTIFDSRGGIRTDSRQITVVAAGTLRVNDAAQGP